MCRKDAKVAKQEIFPGEIAIKKTVKFIVVVRIEVTDLFNAKMGPEDCEGIICEGDILCYTGYH